VVALVAFVVALAFGITSAIVTEWYHITLVVGGSFFTWVAGSLGICAASNIQNQAVLKACMTFVSFEIQKTKTGTE